jgi:hypothetical protein
MRTLPEPLLYCPVQPLVFPPLGEIRKSIEERAGPMAGKLSEGGFRQQGNLRERYTSRKFRLMWKRAVNGSWYQLNSGLKSASLNKSGDG